MASTNKYLSSLTIGQQSYHYYRLANTDANLSRLPLAAKILLENLLRHSREQYVQAQDIQTLANWDTSSSFDTEIAFVPSRVILQDFTGVPALVDLAAMLLSN